MVVAQAGRYTFYFSALTQSGKEAWLDLVHNGKLIVSAFAGEITVGYATTGKCFQPYEIVLLRFLREPSSLAPPPLFILIRDRIM